MMDVVDELESYILTKQMVRYIEACKGFIDYRSFKIIFDEDDYARNKITVVVYYETYYTRRKFNKVNLVQ